MSVAAHTCPSAFGDLEPAPGGQPDAGLDVQLYNRAVPLIEHGLAGGPDHVLFVLGLLLIQ